MPMLSKTNSESVRARVPSEMYDAINNFAAEADLSQSAAMRMLLGYGLEHAGVTDVDQLRVLSYNARAAALQRLDAHLQDALEAFRAEED